MKERIKNNLSPLEYYDGIEDDDEIKRYKMSKTGLENAEWASSNCGLHCRRKDKRCFGHLLRIVWRKSRKGKSKA